MIKRRQAVLARRDENEPYAPENVHWHEAKTDKEERMGIEELALFPNEPESVPCTLAQQQERDRLPKKEREMYDIWLRIKWRSDQSKYQ